MTQSCPVWREIIDKLLAEQARRAACYPDLLAALERMDEHLAAYVETDIDCDDAVDALKQGRAAIAKATSPQAPYSQGKEEV